MSVDVPGWFTNGPPSIADTADTEPHERACVCKSEQLKSVSGAINVDHSSVVATSHNVLSFTIKVSYIPVILLYNVPSVS